MDATVEQKWTADPVQQALHLQLARARFRIDDRLASNLTERDLHVLRRHGAWLEALAHGKLKPLTAVQQRFVQVAWGRAKAKTEHERARVKYNRPGGDTSFASAQYGASHPWTNSCERGRLSLSLQEVAVSFMSEFRTFALKGNVMDLAVGVIIGAAFGKIVDSLVNDVIMPIVGRIFGGLDFSSYYIPLAGQQYGLPLPEAKKLGAVIAYGSFLSVLVNFIILAFIIFLMVRQMNRLKREQPAEAAPAAPPEEVMLLREIRDALRR